MYQSTAYVHLQVDGWQLYQDDHCNYRIRKVWRVKSFMKVRQSCCDPAAVYYECNVLITCVAVVSRWLANLTLSLHMPGSVRRP